MSKIGIVVLNYNDYKETREYIDTIKKFRTINEIVVVDNNSTDASYEVLKRMEKGNITVLKAKENNGYASGNNIGVKYLKGKVDYVIISNPDIILEESVIKKLKKDMDENPEYALVAPVIEQHGEISRGWKLSKITNEIGLNLNYFHKIVEKKLKYDDKKYNSDLTRVDVVSGCFFAVRMDVLNLVGNFDESTFLFYEENILASKFKNINAKSYVDNTVKVIHNESVTINKTMASINKYKILKNSQKYYARYYLHANVFQMFILRFVYYISLLIAYIVYFINKIFKKKK